MPAHAWMCVSSVPFTSVVAQFPLSDEHAIDVGAGVVDADYRGLLGVLLFNFGKEDFKVNVGDRIAQMVLERCETPDVVVVQVRFLFSNFSL